MPYTSNTFKTFNIIYFNIILNFNLSVMYIIRNIYKD